MLVWDMLDAPTADQGLTNPLDIPTAVHLHAIAIPYMGMPLLDKRSALTLHSQFIVAMGSRGRAVVTDLPSIEMLNEICASLSKGSDVRAKVIAERRDAIEGYIVYIDN